MKSLKLLTSFLIFSLFCLSVLCQTSGMEAETIDKVFDSWPANGPGGVVGIVKDGELTFTKAYGLASLEYEVPNTTETIFNIASVTKQFTAYALVLLHEQGKLSIDDDIRKFLPEVPDFGATITIRHLLTHTSGLRNFQNMLGMAGWRDGDPMTNDDLLRFVVKQKELNFPVGEEYLYCNTGFVLATFIVERITGKDFKDWTKENIFMPLGMENTEYREDMTEVRTNTATSYNKQGNNTYSRPLEFYNYMGNGNIYTTIPDLAKWIAHLGSGHENIDILTQRGILNNGDTLSYALGIGVGEFYGHRRWAHGGSIGGYRSNLQYFPDHDMGVIIITNHNTANPGGKGVEIARKMLDIPEPENNNTQTSYPSLSNVIEQDISQYNNYTGAYFVQGVVVDVYEREGNRYMIAKGETPEFPVAAASDTSYFNAMAGVSVYFTNNGREVVINRGGDILRGQRIEVDRSNFNQFEGTYYSPELEATYKIFTKDGNLVGYHSHIGEFGIYPIKDDFIRGSIFQFSDIKVVRWPTGEVKGLRVGNGRVRDLWFDKIE